MTPQSAVPQRTCVGCRERVPSPELLRVVLRAEASGGNYALPDTRRSLPGRGAWVHPTIRCVERAEKRRAFPRALRTSGLLDLTQLRETVKGQDE